MEDKRLMWGVAAGVVVAVALFSAVIVGLYATIETRRRRMHENASIANKTSGTMLTATAVFRDTSPPNIGTPLQTPLLPGPSGDVSVSVGVNDDVEVKSIILRYSTDGEKTWSDLVMNGSGWYSDRFKLYEGSYSVKIPPQPRNTTVLYQIIATDTSGNSAVNDRSGTFFNYTVGSVEDVYNKFKLSASKNISVPNLVSVSVKGNVTQQLLEEIRERGGEIVDAYQWPWNETSVRIQIKDEIPSEELISFLLSKKDVTSISPLYTGGGASSPNK